MLYEVITVVAQVDIRGSDRHAQKQVRKFKLLRDSDAQQNSRDADDQAVAPAEEKAVGDGHDNADDRADAEREQNSYNFV